MGNEVLGYMSSAKSRLIDNPLPMIAISKWVGSAASPASLLLAAMV